MPETHRTEMDIPFNSLINNQAIFLTVLEVGELGILDVWALERVCFLICS